MNKGIIYKLVFPNNKCYIGQTYQKLNKRILKHNKNALNIKSNSYNTKISKAIREFGKDGYFIIILHKNILIKNLNKYERMEIKNNDSFENGYNSTTGGTRKCKLSKEAIRKISDRSKSQRGELSPVSKISQEYVDNMRNDFLSGQFKYRELAKKYNKIVASQVNAILRNTRWFDKEYGEKLKERKKISYKLTKNVVDEIRRKYCFENYSMPMLSREYNLVISCVYAVVRNKIWFDENYDSFSILSRNS